MISYLKRSLFFAACAILLASCSQPRDCDCAQEGAEKKVELEQKAEDTNKEKLEFKDFGGEAFVFDVEEYTLQNENFRFALWTGSKMQMTLMTILPGEDIGLEMHMDIEQFLRVESGVGKILLGDAKDKLDLEFELKDDMGIMVPVGKWHNIVNTGKDPLKLYSIYSPTEHPRSTIHKTRAEGAHEDDVH